MQQEKGVYLEKEISVILALLKNKHPSRVKVYEQPRLVLQNDEIVVPDFDLHVRLLHESTLTLIECQNRERATKQVLHKIQHIRQKSNRKSFFFIHAQPIGEEMERALTAEGVSHFLLREFREYLGFLSAQLYAADTSSDGSDEYANAPTRPMSELSPDPDFLGS